MFKLCFFKYLSGLPVNYLDRLNALRLSTINKPLNLFSFKYFSRQTRDKGERASSSFARD